MGNLNYDFTGRTVLITGAAQGIDLAPATFFDDAGAHTVLVDYDGEMPAQSVAGLSDRALGVPGDVSKTEDAERAVAVAIEHGGRLDVLVNNAGILRDNVLWKISDDDWDAVLATHSGGTFRFTRAAVAQFGAPSEMCAAVGFLASEEAGYVTGVVLPVDGGVSI